MSMSKLRIHLATSGRISKVVPMPVTSALRPVLLTHEKASKKASMGGTSHIVRAMLPTAISST